MATDKMTTPEMELALFHYFDYRKNTVVQNVSWGIFNKEAGGGLHECDILVLSKSNYATEFEIKISKADLKKDLGKPHNHVHNLLANFYYAVPEELVDDALSIIPDRAGLLSVKKHWSRYGQNIYFDVKQIRKAKRNLKAMKWSEAERYQLCRLGSLRIQRLTKTIVKLKKQIRELKQGSGRK